MKDGRGKINSALSPDFHILDSNDALYIGAHGSNTDLEVGLQLLLKRRPCLIKSSSMDVIAPHPLNARP
jgi:hypothetical protein